MKPISYSSKLNTTEGAPLTELICLGSEMLSLKIGQKMTVLWAKKCLAMQCLAPAPFLLFSYLIRQLVHYYFSNILNKPILNDL